MSMSFKVLLAVDELPLLEESKFLEFAAVAILGLDPLRKALASLEVSFPASSDPVFRDAESEEDAVPEETSDDGEELLEVVDKLVPLVIEFEVEVWTVGFSILRSLRTSTLIFSEMFFSLMMLSIASFAVAAGLSDFSLRALRVPRSP